MFQIFEKKIREEQQLDFNMEDIILKQGKAKQGTARQNKAKRGTARQVKCSLPCIYIVWKGLLSVSSSPIITILATQKNKISYPVSNTAAG